MFLFPVNGSTTLERSFYLSSRYVLKSGLWLFSEIFILYGGFTVFDYSFRLRYIFLLLCYNYNFSSIYYALMLYSYVCVIVIEISGEKTDCKQVRFTWPYSTYWQSEWFDKHVQLKINKRQNGRTQNQIHKFLKFYDFADSSVINTMQLICKKNRLDLY